MYSTAGVHLSEQDFSAVRYFHVQSVLGSETPKRLPYVPFLNNAIRERERHYCLASKVAVRPRVLPPK